jgi:hypothetical protein
MYDIGRKTNETTSSSTGLTGIDDSLLISELATSSTDSLNDVKISPVFHRQSQLLGHRKQEEQRQGKSLVDVVAMLRQQRSGAEGGLPTHAPAALQSRSAPLDPDETAQAFRKALRTNSSMNHSKRVSLRIYRLQTTPNSNFIKNLLAA